MEFKQGLMFNASIYKANQENKWKFLDDITPDEEGGRGLGFMVRSPTPVATATIAYLLFVLVIGPFYMRNRAPFQLKTPIRFYNLVMVFTAFYLFHELHLCMENFSFFFDCKRAFTLADASATRVYRLGDIILLVRLSEYLDTIFFTLRKKQNQVTFLHVFHHSFVPLYAYWLLRTAPFRFNVFIIYINSAIHVLMYFYYFLATFQTRPPSKATNSASNNNKISNGQNNIGHSGKHSAMRNLLMQVVDKLLLLKKYITQLQILQFVSLALYTVWVHAQPNKCNVHSTYLTSNYLLALSFLGLFVHFYVRSYRAATAAKAASAKAKRA